MYSQLSKDSKITLPDAIMKELDLKPGDNIELEKEQGKMTLQKAPVHREKAAQTGRRKLDLWDIYGIFIGGAIILAIYSMFFRGMF